MKNVLLAIMMVLVCGTANAAYDYDNSTTTSVTIDNQRVKYTYTNDLSVTSAADKEFRLPADSSKGHIVEIYFESESTDCDIWLSESVDAAFSSADTILYITSINLGYSPELNSPRYYYNTSGEGYLYLTIGNDDAGNPTATWILKITYERY